MALFNRPSTLRTILTVRSASTAAAPLHQLLGEYGKKVKAVGYHNKTILEVELQKFHEQWEDETLLKERADKLGYQKEGGHEFMEKKKGAKELLRRQSCKPIDIEEMNKRLFDFLMNEK